MFQDKADYKARTQCFSKWNKVEFRALIGEIFVNRSKTNMVTNDDKVVI